MDNVDFSFLQPIDEMNQRLSVPVTTRAPVILVFSSAFLEFLASPPPLIFSWTMPPTLNH
jgi:hypothetical protein